MSGSDIHEVCEVLLEYIFFQHQRPLPVACGGLVGQGYWDALSLYDVLDDLSGPCLIYSSIPFRFLDP